MTSILLLFTFTIFWGASLLFVVQPIFGRFLLPLLGGAPAVWNACVLFFQATLLAGYAYAHALSTRLTLKRQVIGHGLLMLVVLVSLPIAIPAGWTPPVDVNPVGWLLVTAAVAVGLPFFAVSATSPLLQRWLSLTRHPSARDPYFLYAASNIGSLLALLGYPLVIEPRLGLGQQSVWWSAGYGVLAVAMLVCGVLALRLRPPPALSPDGQGSILPEQVTPPPPTWRSRAVWMLLAFVPSSLMLSVTNYITMDLASVPLLWVIPLAIYLGTYSLAFARKVWIRPVGSARVLRLALVTVVVTMALGGSEPIWLLVFVHLITLFAAALVCHQQLAARRPAPQHLTRFYFWMALGGVAGGMFNALIAPAVFDSVMEYPLGLVAVSLLLPATRAGVSERRPNWTDLAWPLGLAALCLLLPLLLRQLHEGFEKQVGQLLLFLPPAVLCFWFSRHRLRFALGLSVLLLVGQLREHQHGRFVFAERSFFGILRVQALHERNLYRLFHGTTVHGIQWRDPEREREPLAYYSRSGPLGDVMKAASPAVRQRVAIVGLGAGGASCYAEPGQHWTYYEIDPLVARVARDPALFTYLNQSAGATRFVLGDARITLERVADGEYGLIVLDAYNSDAIPLHLLTREALRLYGSKLAPGGLLAWHITNRHLDLEPVLAALAKDGDWVCYLRDDLDLSPEERAKGRAPSRWAVMARAAADLGSLTENEDWREVHGQPGVRLWTDDYANLFSVLRW